MSGVGDVVDARYRLKRRLGSSPGSTVFLAEDLSLARAVAVRVSDPDAGPDLDRQVALLRNLAFTTSHAVAVLDEGATGEGGRYLVTPFVEGTPLDRLVVERGPLAADAAAAIGEQLLQAAEVARRTFPDGQDAIPAAAILDRDGYVRVTRFAPAPPHPAGDPICPAIGAVLHELLTGVEPRPGESVRDHGREIPEAVADVVDGALTGDVRSSGDLRRRLADARRRLPTVVVPAVPPSRPWQMVVAVGAILVIIIAVTAIILLLT